MHEVLRHLEKGMSSKTPLGDLKSEVENGSDEEAVNAGGVVINSEIAEAEENDMSGDEQISGEEEMAGGAAGILSGDDSDNSSNDFIESYHIRSTGTSR